MLGGPCLHQAEVFLQRALRVQAGTRALKQRCTSAQLQRTLVPAVPVLVRIISYVRVLQAQQALGLQRYLCAQWCDDSTRMGLQAVSHFEAGYASRGDAFKGCSQIGPRTLARHQARHSKTSGEDGDMSVLSQGFQSQYVVYLM